MSKTVIIGASGSLLDEVVGRLPEDPQALSRCLTVFPGKRPGFFLRKALASKLGRSFLPPRIFSYESFIDYMYVEKLGQEMPLLQPIDAVGLLFDIHTGLPDKLGGEYFTRLDMFVAVGLKMFGELEELHLASRSIRNIKELVGDLSYGRLNTFVRYYEEFYRMLEEQGRSTGATRIQALAARGDKVDMSEFDTVLLAGFYALTPADRTIFRSLHKKENVQMIFQQGPGLQKQLQALGIEPEVVQGTAGRTTYSFHKAPDAHGQVFALSGRIRQLIVEKDVLDQRNAIVLPASEALFPVFHQTLAMIPDDQFNISLGYPISRTPLYAFFSNLMELLSFEQGGKLSASSYMKFVLHPYVKNIRFGARTDVTRVLFHTLEEYFTQSRMESSFLLDDLERESMIFERAARKLSGSGETISAKLLEEHLRKIHDMTIRRFLDFGSIREFADRGTELVKFIYSHSTARLHPLFRPYAEQLVGIFRSLAASLIADKPLHDRLAYGVLFRSYCGREQVPFPGTPLRGLQVLGLLETRNLSFERVFILDASDDVVPGRVPDMMLPQAAREKLGLETAHDREKLIEYYLHLLLSGANEVHFFYTEDGKKEKSRFLEKLLWEKEKSGPLWAGDEVKTIRYDITLTNKPPDPIPKSGAVTEFLKEFDYNATAVDTYLRCPLQFYYRFVLDLKEKEEVSDDIEAQDVGKMVHQILSEYYRPMAGSVLRKENFDRGKFTELIEKVCEEKYGRERTGAAFLLRMQIQRKLEEFLDQFEFPRLEKETVELVDVEREVSVTRNGWKFKGRIDRIERRNGRTFILDYKIRNNDEPYRTRWKKFRIEDPATWTESVQSLQLPLYALLYGEQSGEKPSNIVPVYLFLGRNVLDPTIESGMGEDKEGKLYEILEQVLFGVLEEIVDPKAPFRPTKDLKETCPRCPYRGICGTQWVKKPRW